MEKKIYINTLINLSRANIDLARASEGVILIDEPLDIRLFQLMEEIDDIMNRINNQLS